MKSLENDHAKLIAINHKMSVRIDYLTKKENLFDKIKAK